MMTSSLYLDLNPNLYQDLNLYQRINRQELGFSRARTKWLGSEKNSTFELIVSRLDDTLIYKATAPVITWVSAFVSRGFINLKAIS
jgi:hypothetical protein